MGRNFCVIDDDAQVVEFVCGYLESEGHAVSGFQDLRLALAHLETTPAEVLVLDFDMPEVDGVGAVEWARERLPYARLIMLTARASSFTLMNCRKLGSDSCVLKGDHFLSQLKTATVHSLRSLDIWEDSLAIVRAVQ